MFSRAIGYSAPIWHASPYIDVGVYALGWLPMAVLLQIAANDFLPFISTSELYFLTFLLLFSHRHFGIPYAYLDKNVFRQHRRSLIALPICIILEFLTLVIFRFHPHFREFWFALWGSVALWTVWHIFR